MKKIMFLLMILFVALATSGCLVGNRISYVINFDTPTTGTATVTFYNIRSDADGKDKFEEDKYNLFEYMAKSKQFLDDMKKEGKDIVNRELFLDNGSLNAKGAYKFKNINTVENLVLEDGFYYITLAKDDSVVTTNGTVINSANFKRIIWDKSFKKLEFEIHTEVPAGRLIDMAPYYKNYYK